MSYKEAQVRRIYGIEQLGTKRSKDLQNGTHDGTFFVLVECDTEHLQDVCLRQLLGDH